MSWNGHNELGEALWSKILGENALRLCPRLKG
jgi:hypothetical protein